MANTDGSGNPIRLASNLTIGRFTDRLIFSSDGTTIAFIYEPPTGFPFPDSEYYVAPTGGGSAVLIDDQIDIGNVNQGVDFQFSKDGESLFYISGTPDRTNGLFTRAIDALSPRVRLDQLDADFTYVSGQFQLVSEQAKIIYSAFDPGELYSVSVAGGVSTKLNQNGYSLINSGSTLSLDFFYNTSDEKIVYQEFNNDTNERGLFSVKIDGSSRIKLDKDLPENFEFISSYRISADQDKVIFLTSESGRDALFSVSLSGDDLTELSQFLTEEQRINEHLVSPVDNLVVIEAGVVNVSAQPQYILSLDNPLAIKLISPKARAIGEFTFVADGTHAIYKRLVANKTPAFESDFFIANISTGQFSQLKISEDLTINFFERFSSLGSKSVVFRAANVSSETNLYAATLNGQDAIQLNRNVVSPSSQLAKQAIANYVLVPSQNRLIYVGNTDNQTKQELFGLKLSERLVLPSLAEELCVPLTAANGSLVVICI